MESDVAVPPFSVRGSLTLWVQGITWGTGCPKSQVVQTGLPGAFGEELSVTGVRLQDKDPPGSSIVLSGVLCGFRYRP